ncbi:MAG: D-alanyl-D-alanine carboxypeptidase family protein, partial [Alphaproteobacteria bacterium]
MRFLLILFSVLFSFSAIAKEAYIIINEQDGKILLENNATDLRYPASLTKLMTIYLTFDALSKKIMLPNKKMYVSKKAQEQVPTKLNLKEGDKISIENALDAVIIKSANDAAVVLSENLSGSEKTFSTIMTKAAKQIGLSRTNFKNASGLGDDSQVSTAKDLALLGLALYRHFPQYYHLFSKQS